MDTMGIVWMVIFSVIGVITFIKLRQGRTVCSMRWFERHLNWTFFVGSGVIPNLLLFPFYTSYDEALTASFVTCLLLTVVVSLSTEIWYLQQKGRSLWNLCWNLVNGIGFIVLLGLENKTVKEESYVSQ